MASTGKSAAQYRSEMKAIRGMVAFDYDLRRSLNPGQKAAISKAFSQISNHSRDTFVPVRRRAGESARAHAARARRIKQKHGQSGSALGVFVRPQAGDRKKKFTLKRDGTIVQTYRRAGRGRRRIWLTTSAPEFANYQGGDWAAEVEAVADAERWRAFEAEIWFGQYARIRLFDKSALPPNPDRPMDDNFEDSFDELAEQYAKESLAIAVTGRA